MATPGWGGGAGGEVVAPCCPGAPETEIEKPVHMDGLFHPKPGLMGINRQAPCILNGR